MELKTLVNLTLQGAITPESLVPEWFKQLSHRNINHRAEKYLLNTFETKFMKMKKKIIWLVLILMVGLSLACDESDQANKLTDEANAIISKRNETIPEYNKLFTEVFGENITKAEDIEAYKEENKSNFEKLTKMNQESEKSVNEIKGKFEQASKLQIDDEKYKEYLTLRLKEWEKTVELEKADGDFIKTFLETKDVDQINKQISEFDEKKAGLTKESEDFLQQANKIVEENPGSFEKK